MRFRSFVVCSHAFRSVQIGRLNRFARSFLQLLHEKKDEDAVRNFFQEVYELYLRAMLNPFYRLNTPIETPTFDTRVNALGKKFIV